MSINRCRICESTNLAMFLSLGDLPLANAFLGPCDSIENEFRAPLDVYFCGNCGLVQLTDVVDPAVLFHDYAYMTSASAPISDHFRRMAVEVSDVVGLAPEALVVDIGSNDGTLLKGFESARVVGVEPASNLAAIARQSGIETLEEFFDSGVVDGIVQSHGRADLILGTNVFAHVDDLNSFLIGISRLLAPGGTFVIEVPYLKGMLDDVEFDQIYHEHLSYFSVRPLATVFERHNMAITAVQEVPVHGGSIRVFVQRATPSGHGEDAVRMIEREKTAGYENRETFETFARAVTKVREDLRELITGLKEAGSSIIGYGASAKGTVLLNYCGLGANDLDYVTDTTPFKLGRYIPGVHVPIVSPERILKDQPDYALLLAWNYAEQIIAKETEFRKRGGRFIIPVPTPRLV